MGLLTILKKVHADAADSPPQIAHQRSNLVQVRQKEREMRILMVGLDNAGFVQLVLTSPPPALTRRAGKTTVVRKFNGESIDEICPTLGFNIKTMDFQARARYIADVFAVFILF
jgi:hypothetical protein